MITAKSILTLAAALVLVGIMILLLTACAAGGNFSLTGSRKCEDRTHEISEDFSDVLIVSDTADITLLPSEDGSCKVVCYEREKQTHAVTVEDGTLTVRLIDKRRWYDHIGFFFEKPTLTVYLPESQYGALVISEDTGDVSVPSDFCFESIDVKTKTGDVSVLASARGAVKIKTSTGNIRAKELSAASLDLSVSTGKITVASVCTAGDLKLRVSTGKAYLTDVTCKNLTSSGSTGDISLTSVIVEEKLSIERSTGDVRLDASDAAEIYVVTDTGDVKGSLLSEKIFFCKTDTGKVSVPKTATGGICDIKTDTGNIIIKIES